MQGVFPILVTPFDERERVDEDSLRREVDFLIDAGVHGLGIALGSEIQKLTDNERETVIRIVVDQVHERVPVVVNTSAQASYTACWYSRQAEDLGASAVMCLPPSQASASEVRSYFSSISDAVRVPIFIQDQLTAPVSAGLMRDIADAAPMVKYAKVESPPQPLNVQRAVQLVGDRLQIFGGAGGTFFVEELRRGSIGTMPWPSQPEAFVQIWNAWQAGNIQLAREIHAREIVPLARLATAGLGLGHTIHKELLRRRGVIRRAVVRGPSDPLDELTLRELDEICAVCLKLSC
jgi:dihydrodipicolinate synthase/N-acetylneuraminate lyase